MPLIKTMAFNQYNGHEQLAVSMLATGFNTEQGLNNNLVKVFENNNGWNEIKTVLPLTRTSDGVWGDITDAAAFDPLGNISSDAFGSEIAFSGDELLISVPYEDSGDKLSIEDDSVADSGAVEVFKLGE